MNSQSESLQSDIKVADQHHAYDLSQFHILSPQTDRFKWSNTVKVSLDRNDNTAHVRRHKRLWLGSLMASYVHLSTEIPWIHFYSDVLWRVFDLGIVQI